MRIVAVKIYLFLSIFCPSEFTKGMEKKTTSIPRRQLQRNSSSESQGDDKNDGSVSDSALSASVTEGRRRRPSLSHKVASLVGLPWRSSSASQISGKA